MVIVITMHKLSYTKECMDELYDRYHNIVRKFNRLANTITFANGDIIKGYSVDSRRDGLRADVAIGVGAEYLTCRSNILEPVWDLSLIHISEPTRLGMISYAVFCLKKKTAHRRA